jgi:pimeloyl-ACP methyl ester carboxylesterase
VSETLVLLHGFAGTRQTWDRVIAQLDPQRYRPLALDLPGHGESSSYERLITFEGCVEQVLAAAPRRFVLCGYSMGGRIALHAALAAPDRRHRGRGRTPRPKRR